MVFTNFKKRHGRSRDKAAGFRLCMRRCICRPSFLGHAIISRILQAHGYTVGIIAQPDYRDKESVTILGEPRLGFLVSGGNMDSMVNHYSVSKRDVPMMHFHRVVLWENARIMQW